MQHRFDSLVHRIDPAATLSGARELTGGMSARITVLDLDRPDGSDRLVVREYGTKNRQAHPTPAQTEVGLLQHLSCSGFPAPSPVLADDGEEVLGGPYAVVGFVDGDGPPAMWSPVLAEQLVAVLVRLHRLPLPDDAPPAYSERVARWLGRSPERADESMRESRIREVLRRWWPYRDELPARILHGDFWPGNTVWQQDRLVAVIDWEDAAIGDPRSDLANLRLEVLWAYGPEAAADVTVGYAEALPEVDLAEQPYWDLVAASRPVGRLHEWGLDSARMDLYLARFQTFVDEALARIGG